MEPRQIKGVLFDAFGTLCHIESPRLPYRSIVKRWEKGAADCYQAIMTRDVPLAEFAGEAGLSQEEAAFLEAHVAVTKTAAQAAQFLGFDYEGMMSVSCSGAEKYSASLP